MEATKKDELFDDELCGMVKFTVPLFRVLRHLPAILILAQ